MNLKTLMKSVLMTALLLGLMSIASFAQVYVNNTNGDDDVYDGKTATTAFKTITKALSVVPAGGTISIAADTYTESTKLAPGDTIKITKPVTIVGTTFNSLSVVTITRGIQIITTNASDVVNLGRTADNSVAFNIGKDNPAAALVLTKGNLQISTANVTLVGGSTITRTAGTLDNPPTVTNVNVVYNGTADVTAAGELPANIGTGKLTVNIAAGKTVTTPNGLTTSGVTGGVLVLQGNTSFAGNLTLSTSNLTNQGVGNTVTVGGNVTFTYGHIVNQNTGAITVNGNITWTAKTDIGNAVDNTGNGNVTLAGNVSFVKDGSGTTPTAGNPLVLLNNAGTGKVVLAKGFTLTSATWGSPAVTYTPSVSALNGAAGTFEFDGVVTLTDLTNAAAGKVVLTGGTIAGTVANNNGGTVELLANLTFSGATFGNNNPASVVKLNANTLTLSKDGAALNNAGKIISVTSATVGAGTVAFTNNGTIAAGVELPNLSLASGKSLTASAGNVYGNVTNNGTMTLTTAKVFGSVTSTKAMTSNIGAIAGNLTISGTSFTSNVPLTVDGDITSSAAFTLGSGLVLKGNYAQNVGATLAMNTNTFEVWGNWIRTSNVPNDVTFGVGAQLLFNKGNAQVFTPGASLTLSDVVVSKDANTVVTLNQSLQIARNFAINSGKVDLGDYNIRMVGATGAFTNAGNFYSTTGNGYLIFEGANGAYSISGSGAFSNMDIRSTSTVTAGSNINFSGKLILRDGVLAVGANVFTYKNDIMTVPTVTRYVPAGTMTAVGGTIQVANGVVYDLTYMGSANAAVASEWIAGGIRNLTIATGDATHSYAISGPTADFTIAGNLTVNLAQTLDLNTHKITFQADGMTHSVAGTVANGLVEVTGDAVKINGSTDDNAAAEVPTLTVNTTAAKSFASADLKKINGDLTVVNGTSVVTMNAKKAVVTGNVTLTAGSLNLGMNSTVSTHNGNLVVTDGTMTYTRNTDGDAAVANRTIGGNVTLTAGSLTLGSTVLVAGTTSMKDGGLVLNGNNYVQLGSAASPDFTRNGAGTITGNNGAVVFDATNAAIDVTPGTDFSIPVVEFKGANGTTLNDPMAIGSTLTHTSGPLAINTLTLNGNTYNYKAGTYTSGTLVFTGANTTATLYGNVTIPGVKVDTQGKVVIVSNDTDVKRTLTVSTAFDQVAGTVDMGKNDVVIAGTYTRTAGNFAQTSGTLVFNTAGAVDVAEGFVVDNMKVAQSVDFTTKALKVNKYLTLASGALKTDEDGKLSFGNGASIERQSVGATLVKLPTFGSDMSVLYTKDWNEITTANELPAAVKNLTVSMGLPPAGPNGAASNGNNVVNIAAGSVKLAANVTVNGTLSLASLIKAAYSDDVAITMADGATLELKADGTTVLDENLTRAGKINIVYNGASNTTTRELGATTNATTHTAGNVTFKSNVKLDADATFTGEVVFDGANFDINGKNLYVQGDLTQKTVNNFFIPTAGSDLYFTGNTNTKITLKDDQIIDGNLTVVLKKTNGTNTITLCNGNLDFATNHQVLNFNNGLLVTNGYYVKLDAAPGKGQGFVRNAVAGANMSHIVGDIQKSLENHYTMPTASDPRVEFPLGSLTAYRPVALTFNPTNGNQPTTPNATLTVSAVATAPTGTAGLPIADGVSAGVPVARYGDFYWTIKSDVGVSPSIVFDIEMTAAGFTTYKNIANIRIIRRNGTIADISNQWKLQGGQQYDNLEIAGIPSVILRGANAGIIAGGAVYTYGLETNLIPQQIADQALVLGAGSKKLVLTNSFLGNSGTLTFAAQSSNNNVATVAINADTLTINPVGQGSADITVTGKDGLDFATNTFKVTVTPKTNFFVKGSVKYDNTAATALKDVKVTLTPGNASATTDASGNYSIADVQNGTYTVTATTTAPWMTSAVNSADALLAAQFTVDPVKYPLSAIRQAAADVNNDGKVNSTDALLIMRRTVKMDSSFAKGNWVFTSQAVTVNGADVTANVSGLAVGDVNGSAVFTGSLAKANFVNEGSVKVNAGSTISVPVKVDAENLAALTLSFKYSKDLGTFAGISSKLNGIMANEVNGVVTVAWADLSAMNAVNATSDEAFITLNFKASEAFKAGKSFSIDMNSAELVNADGKVMNAMLKASSVDAVVPSEFALKQNYPNPFNPSTTISYDLPVNSKVTLVVRNILGQEVATLVNGVQEAGQYKLQFNANNLTSGIYFYTINVSNGDQKFTQTYKMILMK